MSEFQSIPERQFERSEHDCREDKRRVANIEYGRMCEVRCQYDPPFHGVIAGELRHGGWLVGCPDGTACTWGTDWIFPLRTYDFAMASEHRERAERYNPDYLKPLDRPILDRAILINGLKQLARVADETKSLNSDIICCYVEAVLAQVGEEAPFRIPDLRRRQDDVYEIGG